MIVNVHDCILGATALLPTLPYFSLLKHFTLKSANFGATFMILLLRRSLDAYQEPGWLLVYRYKKLIGLGAAGVTAAPDFLNHFYCTHFYYKTRLNTQSDDARNSREPYAVQKNP